MSEADLLFRAYEPRDRDAVRAICCATAFRNVGASALLGDEELFGDYWTAYYTDHEPGSALVAEHEGRVVGYLLGCTDTRRFRRTMAREIVPGVLARLAWRGARGRFRGMPRARRFIRWLATRAWREEAIVDIERYPVHYHANLAPDAYRRSAYSGLASRFLDVVEARGHDRLHGLVTDHDGGAWQRLAARYERQRPGWHDAVSIVPSSFGREVLDDPRALVNIGVCARIPEFRGFLSFLSQRVRM